MREDDQRAISIAVLGPLAVDGIKHKIKRAATYELLAYLAFRSQGASRDELTEAIWPGQDPKRTRPRLWQSVSEAKRALGDAWLHHGERYQLDRAKVRVDLDDLDRLLTAASDDGNEPAMLEKALALWRGEPLEGTDYLWAEGERRNLHAMIVDLLERVGRARLAHGDARAALQLAEQAIGLEELSQAGAWRCKPNTPSAYASRSPVATTNSSAPSMSSLGLNRHARHGSSTGSCWGGVVSILSFAMILRQESPMSVFLPSNPAWPPCSRYLDIARRTKNGAPEYTSPVHWWRLSRSRSLRRRAKHQLRRTRTVTGPTAWRQHIVASSRQLDVRWPMGLALVLHVPFVLGLLDAQLPSWLDTAWLVSATLVGLGVALVVFLLQAASSQSLSSQETFGAVVANTWIVWPTSLALTFLVSIGALERYGARSGAPPAWANTWAFIAFVCQIIAFGVAFARTLRVVSPAGVVQILRATARDAMGRAVEDALLRRHMIADLHQLSDNHASYGLFARGQPILAEKAGRLVDVDRRLPQRLDEFMVGDAVTLTLDPGRSYEAKDSLAKCDGVNGGWLDQMIRQAVVIRHRHTPPLALPVFNDVLDVSRRALASGSHANFRDSMQLVVDCLADLPDIYHHWGITYTIDNVREPFSISTEDEILRALAGLSDDAFRSSRVEAITLVPQVAAGLVHVGLSKNASLLTEQGAALWRHQLHAIKIVGDTDVEQRLHEQIGRLGAESVALQQHPVEDRDIAVGERLAVQPGLVGLFRHQVEVLKIYIDNRDTEHFAEAWGFWSDWAKNWEPEHDVEELQLLSITAGGFEQSRAARALDGARALADAKRKLEDTRSRLVFALGSWALARHQQGKLQTDEWLRLVSRLASVAVNADGAVQLLRTLEETLELQPLRTWQLRAWDGKQGWQPDDRAVALLWGTVLLLRAIEPTGTADDLNLGPSAADIGRAVIANLDSIVAAAPEWEEAVGGQLAARVSGLRTAVEDAVRRESEQISESLAHAPLDSVRVQAYIERQRQAYVKGDYLRERLLIASAVERVVDDAEDLDSAMPTILPKRPFVDLPGRPVTIDPERAVNGLVQQQLRTAYEVLARAAQPVQGEGARGTTEAIKQLRSEGHMPDAVLLPRDPYVRALLSGHSDWEWENNFMRDKANVARLSGVPVYEPGPSDATALIVCDLGASLRRVEHYSPGESSPMRVVVKLIDQERAIELWALGVRTPGIEGGRDPELAALVAEYVEILRDIRVTWRTPAHQPAALRIDLPPQGQRERRTIAPVPGSE